ncbi:Predicted arabinose efflux permease, MFS family [Micromonospora phaseoli]|uniref:Predicted arabinose efflux permease, MFS family n=1 Tax=Micromonospora phaseoli TaxID=1144548 RepID=A0A1H6UV54_9ACTN|nr:putative MFS family arabinose efflux permease [Micromonospora phaseoli]GIJ76225.1 MFS transporter [Micromonospora phaseoli]SEI91832.1 Predicted arabinose efflux permease, MFS family [Micromonospora phaseoli]
MASAILDPVTGVEDAPRTDPGADSRPDPRGLGGRFWRLWSASAVSNLADGIVKIALPLIAVGLTSSPVLVAGVVAAFSLPWLLFALPAGALVDRLDRRRVMLAANTLRAGLFGATAVAVALDAGSIWLLYLVAFGAGVAETLYDTSAQSILPQVVPRELLPRANGQLHAVELAANQFVGPPLAGFLVAASAALALAGPAGLWAVAVAALLLVGGRFRVERNGPTTLRADIAEGVRFLWRHRLLRTLATMVGGSNLITSAIFAVLVLYAVGPGSAMRLTEPGYGLLLTTIAAGIVLGSLVAGRIEKLLGRARALGVSVVAMAAVVGVPALSTNPFVIGAVFFGGGILLAAWNVITISLRQRITPDRLLGRVNSSYRLLAWGSIPIGALAGGLLAELFGLRAVFAIMGVLAFTLLFGMLQVTDANIDAAERDAAN